MTSLRLDLIIENILTLLPSKSLIRFSSACKEWYSVITSPAFVLAHFLRDNGQDLLLCEHTKTCRVAMNIEAVVETTELHHLADIPEMYMHHSGSCNGLICYASEASDEFGAFVLYNPYIQKYRRIVSDKEEYECNEVVGLGFHEPSLDHRIVRIRYGMEETYGSGDLPAEVDVYSIRADAWHVVDAKPTVIGYTFRSAFVNGATHWLATTRHPELYTWSRPENQLEAILFFDMVNECFGEMWLPEGLRGKIFNYEIVGFSEFDGSLGVLSMDRAPDPSIIVDVGALWVMGEYGVEDSWSKKFRFLRGDVPRGYQREPRGFTRNGMLVYTDFEEEFESDAHVFRDLNSNKEIHIDVPITYYSVYESRDNLFLLHP